VLEHVCRRVQLTSQNGKKSLYDAQKKIVFKNIHAKYCNEMLICSSQSHIREIFNKIYINNCGMYELNIFC